MSRIALPYRAMKLGFAVVSVLLCVANAEAQLQVELQLKRLQYVAYEPIIATLGITNLAGRDVDLHDAAGQPWFGFEITTKEGQPIGSVTTEQTQPPLRIEAGKKVTQQINLTPLYAVHDLGTYHLRAHVYFADLDKFFYSQGRVFEVTDARPIWQRSVGSPEGGGTRTYSLLSNRFPDHTSLYVRVEDKDSGVVYATYSLGRSVAFDEPEAEVDRSSQLHVLHCAAPRIWAYSRIDLNGELVAHASFTQTKSRPRLVHTTDGAVAVRGGLMETQSTQAARESLPKLSERPPRSPNN
jgi:hypothetical protein